MPIFRGFNGIFDDGQTQTITCESTGSRPAANITWYMDGRKQNNPNTHTYQNPDGTSFVTSSISKRFDKSMDGVNLTCKAMNVVLQRQHRLPVETTVILRAACKFSKRKMQKYTNFFIIKKQNYHNNAHTELW